jgi:DNA-binding LytR/AlgR family response regulator
MNIVAIGHDQPAASQLESHCRAILAGRLQEFAVAPALVPGNAAFGRFDVVLLDPPLPGSRPFGSLTGTPTIVISAHTSLALEAFDQGAIDFVPKPVNRERLARALLRVAPRRAAPVGEPFIAVRRLYVAAEDKYSALVRRDGRRMFHDRSIGWMESRLPPSFVRIHKSYLVRFLAVSRVVVRKGSRYTAVLTDGQHLPIGRSRYPRLRALLM